LHAPHAAAQASDSGTSFVRLVEELLLKSSQALLAGTAEPVTGMALKLGYTDTAHFTRAFKRWTGMSPSVYRRARS
jgi:AraC-like DNA-binding protein